MKTVAMHQPHYFPWLGYLDKMAKADEFVVLDEVQFTDRSPMHRNKFLQLNGEAKLLSLSVCKKGYREKATREIELSNWDETRKKHRSFLEYNYKNAPFFDEVAPRIFPIFETDFQTLLDIDMSTINILRDIFGITTEMTMQSSLPYDERSKNKDLMLDLCLATKGDVYLSGQGARAYMDDERFNERGVGVAYQEFSYPVYPQKGQVSFVSGLSAIDCAFQCGIDGARKVFYDNMRLEVAR